VSSSKHYRGFDFPGRELAGGANVGLVARQPLQSLDSGSVGSHDDHPFHHGVSGAQLSFFNTAGARFPSAVKFLDFPALHVTPDYFAHFVFGFDWPLGEQPPVDWRCIAERF